MCWSAQKKCKRIRLARFDPGFNLSVWFPALMQVIHQLEPNQEPDDDGRILTLPLYDRSVLAAFLKTRTTASFCSSSSFLSWFLQRTKWREACETGVSHNAACSSV